MPEIHAAWNSPALVDTILRAWEEDRPIALLNPVMMALPGIGTWVRSLGPSLGEGLPPGFQAILLTSGTTGGAKLVALGRGSITWNVATVSAHLNLPDGHLRTPLALPLFHAFGLVLGLFLTHLRGGRLELVDAARLLSHLARWPRDPAIHALLLLVPGMVRSLPQGLLCVPELRGTSITGGAPVRRRDLAMLAAGLPGFTHTIGYGLTEAGPALAHTRGEVPTVDAWVGAPLPGVELKPAEPRGGERSGAERSGQAEARDAADGCAGWRFRSPGQASAVLERGSSRWNSVEGAWLATGDLLEPGLPSPNLIFRGRTAWSFKKKGETISPQWIEDAIWAALEAPDGAKGVDAGVGADSGAGLGVDSGAGLGVDSGAGLGVGAWTPPWPADGLVVVSGGSATEAPAEDRSPPDDESVSMILMVEARFDGPAEARLRAAIDTLPSFVRPDRIVWCRNFPRTVLGKVERRALSSEHDLKEHEHGRN